jgi:RND family efflux transporter MFP subunit
MSKLVRNLVIPAVIIALCVLIAVQMMNSRSSLPRRERAAVVPAVASVVVEPGNVPVTIASRGIVTSRRNIELVSEVSGKVIWVAPEFLQGGYIGEGTPLLRIDPIDYEVALSDAKAAVASARLSLAEVKVVLMRAAIDEAEARVEAAMQRLRQAQEDLANTEIKAPFDAVVDIKRVDLGQYVATGTALMKLLSTGTAQIRLPLLPSDVPFVQYGKKADGSWHQSVLTARFGNIEYQWQARLVRVERRVDEQTRVFFLVAEVDQPYNETLHDQPLSVGLFVEAQFTGRAIEQAVRLPRSAIHHNEQLYTIENSTLQRRAVKLLRREADSVIVGGLEAGDRVLLSRLDLMADGMAVTVSE